MSFRGRRLMEMTVVEVFFDKYEEKFRHSMLKNALRKLSIDQLHNLVTEVIDNVNDIYEVIDEKRRDTK